MFSKPRISMQPILHYIIIKSLILSKIYYGINLYDFSPKTSLRKIKIILNSALIMAFKALRSTPIYNMVLKAGINPIAKLQELPIKPHSKTLAASYPPWLLPFDKIDLTLAQFP